MSVYSATAFAVDELRAHAAGGVVVAACAASRLQACGGYPIGRWLVEVPPAARALAPDAHPRRTTHDRTFHESLADKVRHSR
ncbi:hypothetical protein EVAR_19909_1 [Eumeta japonica]|uniref:Uncharacterized protein n=1 Tax=Eumeta variegata TaxID=151549 RepID=A0A4C1ZJ07_EUMVA|nr:hypothetical protein EVAR_19909_1 [Eumeta japonica]